MALYNNGYPSSYQQYYYPQAQQQNSSIIWVQGEAGAKSYLVAPNTTVQLWDSESQTIYLKSADATGMPSIKTLDYTIRELPSSSQSTSLDSVYATKDDLNSLRAEIDRLKSEMKGANHGKSPVSSNGKQSKQHSQ